ncbi:ester cyclase [Arthrobacter sp. ISL-30]|uniref:ester cyclase n=1 Tax=Arthrobacter sp. ISL-30 TaxID=2819109 RepID=UPI001BE80293|nr:ester cyclase [Arthrobacter sp. ISL-30]MBT2514583.1 ester cyclase [Arthrobacter sp. ISL-30]
MSQAQITVITRLVEEVLAGGDLGVVDELYVPRMAPVARRWIEPFRASFPDARMQIVQVVASQDAIAVRFRCSGTHIGPWLGHPPTGLRFENIDEVYFFTFEDGLIAKAWGLEDNLERFRQLQIDPFL